MSVGVDKEVRSICPMTTRTLYTLSVTRIWQNFLNNIVSQN